MEYVSLSSTLRTFMKYILLVLTASCLPLISMFLTSDLPHTHDGLVHIPRMAAYFKALSDGEIPVRWAGDLNYGYGMPLFNFIYPLPYFIASLFLFLGFSLVVSFKLSLALSYLLSGIFMFLFANALFKDEKKAMFVAIFYQFAPFRLVELLIRGSFGEVYTYTFLPLVLFGLTNIFKKFTYNYFLLTSIACALLILSHNSISFVFFALCLGYVFFFSSNPKNVFVGVSTLMVGSLLSSFYWVPAIFEHKYTYGDLFMKNLYLSHFPLVQNFFIPNFFNSKALQTEGISVQIGLFHVIGLFISVFIMFKVPPFSRWHLPKDAKRLIIFCLALIALSFFFMQPISKSFWATISFLRQFQFPWRFLSIVSFTTSLLAICYWSIPIFKMQWVYGLVTILVMVSTAYYWYPSLGYDKINEPYYWNFPLNTTYYGETDVIWSAGPAHAYPKSRVEVIGGKATIEKFVKQSNLQTFTVDAENNVRIVSHTQYFPGWKVQVDNKQFPIQFQDPNHRGEITFSIPKGIHSVKVIFGETKTRFITDVLSLVTFALLISIWFWGKYVGGVVLRK